MTAAGSRRNVDQQGGGRRSWIARRLGGRALLLLVAFVSLYVLLPSLLETFTSWRDLFDLAPEWIAFAIALEALSFTAIWELQRIALQTRSRLPVTLSQLAGNALGRIIPGGGAAAAALQHRMLPIPAGGASYVVFLRRYRERRE